MPYKTLADLPTNIKEILPKHAQEVYVAAFNNAWEEYAAPQKRRMNDEHNHLPSQEETAHKVAWAAVKHIYHKDVQGNWVKNEAEE